MTKWKGTIVPNTGHVDKVYLNTSLSKEEVTEMLKLLSYDPKPNYLIAFPVSIDDREEIQAIGATRYSDDSYGIFALPDFTIFNSQQGWLITDNEIAVSEWGSGEVINNIQGYTIGGENYKITSLFSSTPFEQGFPTRWKGTTVPNSGYVRELYFNINMSIDEVIEELKKLDYVIDSSIGIQIGFCLILHTPSVTALFAIKLYEAFFIVDFINEAMIFYSVEQNGMEGIGWNHEYVEYFGGNAFPLFDYAHDVIDLNGFSGRVGEQNGKISSLFSITQFKQAPLHDPILNIRKSALIDVANAIRQKTSSEKLIEVDSLDYKIGQLKHDMVEVGGPILIDAQDFSSQLNEDLVRDSITRIMNDILSSGIKVFYNNVTTLNDESISTEWVQISSGSEMPWIYSDGLIVLGISQETVSNFGDNSTLFSLLLGDFPIWKVQIPPSASSESLDVYGFFSFVDKIVTAEVFYEEVLLKISIFSSNTSTQQVKDHKITFNTAPHIVAGIDYNW